jgi:hypothetical protein
MKLHTIRAILAIALLQLASCAGINVFGRKVEIVSNRNADGTFKPVSQVTNSAGESPDSSATLYHYPSGGIGVSAWYNGPLAGMEPKLTR